MTDDHFGKRVMGTPALQRFMSARASGTASMDELKRLAKAAEDEQVALAAIESDQSFANGKSIDEFLADLLVRGPIGRCGRSLDAKCGMKDPRECHVHHAIVGRLKNG